MGADRSNIRRLEIGFFEEPAYSFCIGQGQGISCPFLTVKLISARALQFKEGIAKLGTKGRAHSSLGASFSIGPNLG
jgi:hypothetical protein